MVNYTTFVIAMSDIHNLAPHIVQQIGRTLHWKIYESK